MAISRYVHKLEGRNPYPADISFDSTYVGVLPNGVELPTAQPFQLLCQVDPCRVDIRTHDIGSITPFNLYSPQPTLTPLARVQDLPFGQEGSFRPFMASNSVT